MKSESKIEENEISLSPKKVRGRPKVSPLDRKEQMKIASQKHRDKNKAIKMRIENTLIQGINAAIYTLSDETVESIKDRNIDALNILKYYLETWKNDT